MKTRRYLFLICIFFSSAMYAAPNVIKAVKNELTALTEYARHMVCDYQNGKPVHSLVAHYLDERNYSQMKVFLSAEQHERILTGAQLVDYTFQLSNNPQSIHACFAHFCNELMVIRQSVCNGTVAAKRKVPKKDYAAIERNSLHVQTDHASVAHDPVSTKEMDEAFSDLLKGMSEGDQKKLEDAMEALQNPVPSLLGVLMENKGKIAMGLVTLYAVLAKANDWPPYDKKPEPIQATWRSWLGEQATQVGETISMMGG